MDYKKLIEDNKNDFNDADNLQDFLQSYHDDDKTPEDYEDDLHEYADGLVPIYYNDIVKEWQETGECRGMGAEQGLTDGAEGDVYKIMQIDLYAYYYNQLAEDLQTLKDLADEQDED